MVEQNRHILYKIKPALEGNQVADAIDIEVDRTGLDLNTATNSQETNTELERALALIASGNGGQPTQGISGPFVPFTSSVNVGSSNINLYAGNIALYSRSDNARVNFILPTDAEITTSGVDTGDQVEFTILHQGGTARFDTGGGAQGPDNTVRIDVEGANNIRRNTATGTLLNFIEAHQNDIVTLTQSARGEPWVAVRVTLSNAALLLPSGLFRLQVGVQVSLNPALGFIAGLPSGVTPVAGNAYEVSTGNDDFGGYGVETGDVIVALIDNPSRLITADNDDWLVIRNATNDIITLSEIRFLNNITEVDSFADSRLISRSDVNAVRVFLSTGILDHAPFINPSTDSNNPQSDGTSYVGGDEKDGDTFEFRDTANHPSALLYLDIDGTFDVETNESEVFVVIKDREGAVINSYSLEEHFRSAVLPGSSDTYYILDHFPNLQDNYSSINYINGYTIDVVYRQTIRQFNLGSAVHVLPAIADGEIPIAKLEPNAQALLQADHSLDDSDTAKLAGLQTSGTPTDWTAGELLVKLSNDASPSNELSSYHNVGQQNGILGQFGQTTDVTFLVPNFVTVNGLQRTDDTSVTIDVNSIGTILDRQAFTATLPASSFDINNPVGDAWQVDGTASNLFLSGANNTFKITQSNLDQGIIDRLNAASNIQPQQLPDVLDNLSHDLTVAHTTDTEWRELPLAPNTPRLTRQFAALWDENRRSFGTDNYFDDLTGVTTSGYGQNNVFFYSDPNDSNNTSFPGAQSYILNDNIRIRNSDPLSPVISDNFRKIIAFDYALQRPLNNDEEASMLRIGPSGTTPAIGLSHEEGLYLNIGRGDGGQRSRTITTPLELATGGAGEYPFGTFSGLPTSGEAEFLGPNTNLEGTTYPVTVNVHVRLDNNGNDEGVFSYSYVINDINTDQAETQFTATHTVAGSTRSFTWGIRYDANHNHATFGQQNIIFIRDVNPEANPALTDYVSMSYDRTVTWNAPSTYARQTINAGNGHDDFGLFDPTRYNTEHVHERNRVILAFRPFDLTDTSSDPEMAVHVIVDGEKEGDAASNYLIRLHRPMNDFDFDDMSFGNNICAVSHIQCYDYDSGHLFGENTLLDYYNAADQWLGRFRHANDNVDRFILDAGLELAGNRVLTMTDTEDGNRKTIEINDGNILIKNA